MIGMTDNAIEKIYTHLFFNKKPKNKLSQIIELNMDMEDRDKEIRDIIGTRLFSEILTTLCYKERQCEQCGFTVGFKCAMFLMLASIGKE